MRDANDGDEGAADGRAGDGDSGRDWDGDGGREGDGDGGRGGDAAGGRAATGGGRLAAGAAALRSRFSVVSAAALRRDGSNSPSCGEGSTVSGAPCSPTKQETASNTVEHLPQRTLPLRATSCAGCTRKAVPQVGQRVMRLMPAPPRATPSLLRSR